MFNFQLIYIIKVTIFTHSICCNKNDVLLPQKMENVAQKARREVGGEEQCEQCPEEYNLFLDMRLSSMPRIQLPTKQNLDHRDEMRLIWGSDRNYGS